MNKLVQVAQRMRDGSQAAPVHAARALPEHDLAILLTPTNSRDISQAPFRPAGPMVGPDFGKASCPVAPQQCPFGGACHACPARVQRKMVNKRGGDEYERNAGSIDAPPIVHEVLDSPGQPLDAATRAFVESRFGRDFSQVRAHTDAVAAESALALNARAYTVGRDIVFGAGQYGIATDVGRRLLAHELAHTLQQQTRDATHLTVVNSVAHEREADAAAGAVHARRSIPPLSPLSGPMVLRQQLGPDEPVQINRTFELDPQMFLRPMEATAPKEVEECDKFPGGSTDCEVDERTGTPTGKVTQRIDETNPCTRPCVEKHEAVHVKQLRTFCPQLRDCYLAADKGKRPVTDCVKMAIFGMKERECEAYKVSTPCVEERLRTAKVCQSQENRAYGTRKLASEKCFRDKNCGT
jgi:hypothetical protein